MKKHSRRGNKQSSQTSMESLKSFNEREDLKKQFSIDSTVYNESIGRLNCIENLWRFVVPVTSVVPMKDKAETEHYWKLYPFWIVRGTSHTLLEVIHSSNREHRHRLTSDSEQGYYCYIWPLNIPANNIMSKDFDKLFLYHAHDHCEKFIRKSDRFNRDDFALAIEDTTDFMNKVAEIHLTADSSLEVK